MRHKITYKKGNIVHLGEKPYILDLIHEKFGENKFLKSEIMNLLDRDLSIKSVSRHLDTLTSMGWLNSKKIGKKTSKDSRNYCLSKKSQNYLRKYWRFIYGPFSKRKEPEKVFVEKEVEKEIIKESKDEYAGEF